jgi:hypothetical protein
MAAKEPEERMSAHEFKVAMARLGYGTSQLAAAIGLSPSRISRMRTGRIEIPRVIEWGIRGHLIALDALEKQGLTGC